MEQGNYVELSEYMLGVENALSVTRYTPKGKQVFERVDAKASVSGALKPITARDIKIVKRKIRNNIQIIVSPPNRVADYNDLDNFKRILDGKSPQKPQLRF